jgi:thiamine pyrophosphate-dependent acetolactate synthase large subunit-like protein
MAELVADYTLKRLREWGIRHVFGYPGGVISESLKCKLQEFVPGR